MKAAFLTGIRKVEIREVPPPAIEKPDQVLLRVATVGMCGSDMHYYRNGRIGSQVIQFPWSVGHECAGTVVEAGPGVRRLKVGDRVAVDPLIVCGRCDQCLGDRENTCRNQKFLGCPGQAPGALAELIVMPEKSCFPIPQNLSFTQATLVEPFAIGLYAERLWTTHAKPCVGLKNKDKRIAVLGSGPIGLSVLASLKTEVGGKVYVTDIRDNRLEMARTFGADWTGNPHKQNVTAALKAAEPLGFDAVFECAGQQETLDQALDLLTPGGTLMIAGIPEGDRISFNPDLMRRKELSVRNVRRQNDSTADAIALVASGKVNLDPMVTHEFLLERTPEAFELVADYRDGVVKAMIQL